MSTISQQVCRDIFHNALKNMNFTELQDDLQKLINKKLYLSDFGKVLDLSRSNISKRAQNGSEVTISELEKIQEALGVKLYTRVDDSNIKICDNSGERQNDTSIPSKVKTFGIRLTELQDQHEYLDKDMAKLLKISEEDYIDLKLNDTTPDLDILVRLKQCFKISIDWLLFGE